jgi:thioredoxin
MMDVTIQNFEAEVIEASMTTPVLVDFWAPWCGPCKSLGPVLEKVEVAYEGRFKLVKIDSDQEQQLAQAFGIKSIPTCVLLMNGQPVDGFMGALPEGQVKQFLDKHLPAEGELPLQAAAQEAPPHPEAADAVSARAALEQALAELERRFEPGLVFYLAGADPHEGDRLGRLKLSHDGLLARDRQVFDWAWQRRIPLAFVMAGGYGHDIETTVQAQINTWQVAYEYWQRWQRG